MFYAVLVVGLLTLFGGLIAHFPARRGVLATIAYPVGWVSGELAYYRALLQIILLGLYLRDAPEGRHLIVAVLVSVVAIVIDASLVRALLASRRAVKKSLSTHELALSVPGPSEDKYLSAARSVALFPKHPRWLEMERDIVYGPHSRQRLDVWRTATTPAGAPVILYLHGGAWTFGDKREQGRPMLHEFAARGWVVVTANYRLAPKDPWPAQIEDATMVLAWIKRYAHEYGGDPSRVVVSGGSAGGHLAALLALTSEQGEWHPEDAVGVSDWRVAGAIPLYGVLEMTGDEDHWHGLGAGLRRLLEERVVLEPFAGNEDLYRAMSPMSRIHEAAPPFLVVQGRTDTLVDVHVARDFVGRFNQVALAPIYYVELGLTQHAFDVTSSARTSAVTRAALSFASAVAAPSPPPSTWDAYEEAAQGVEVELDGCWLRAHDAAARLGPFAVVLADNPASRRLDSVQNVRRREVLEASLARRGVTRHSARVAATASWPEEAGVALVGRPRDFVASLARAYGQAGFYSVSAEGDVRVEHA